MLPHDVFLTYRAVIGTGLIGPNLKVLTMLVLPIALVLWPFIVALVSSIIAIIWPIYIAQLATFDSDENVCFGGCLFDNNGSFPALRNAVNATRDYWHFNYHSVFDYLLDIRSARSQNPFDIEIFSVIVGTVQAIICSSWLIVVSTILLAIKGVFIIFSAYYYLFREAIKSLMEYKFGQTIQYIYNFWVSGFTGFFFAFALIPVIYVLAFGAFILTSGYFGIDCALMAYKHGFCAGFKQASNYSRIIDQCTSWTICWSIRGSMGKIDSICSFFPKYDLTDPEFDLTDSEYSSVELPAQNVEHDENIVRNALGSVSMQQVWDNFFTQCEETIRLGLKNGVIKQDDIDSYASFIFIGVPAAVVIQCASNSINYDSTTDDLKFSDGLVMTPKNRPHNIIANQFYDPMVKLKRDMKHANLYRKQVEVLWDAALCQNANLISGIESKPKAIELFSQATNMGVLVSRLPQFRRRFCDAIATSKVER